MLKRRAAVGCLFCLFTPVTALAQLTFSDITSSAGVAGPSHFGGHGIMWADVTADGRPDMYVTMTWPPTQMADLFYRNVNGTQFAEEAAARGVSVVDDGSHGGCWGDLDNDGDYDLISGRFSRNRVYQNNGAGVFTDRTAGSGFVNVGYGTRAALMFDFDNDGDLDVLFNNWEAINEPNEFYRNDGNFQFTSIDNGLGRPLGLQGATEADFDNDGDLDILICRGWEAPAALTLMRNTGGSFTPVSNPGFGITHPGQDGATWADVNNDGWLDVHAQRGDIGGNGTGWLFINNKNGTFTQRSVPQGPGFMTGFEDLDNDGDWDMVYAGDNKIYLNDGAGNFTASATFNPGPINDPRGVAFADIDGDGDMDFFYAQKRGFNRLIRNNLTNGGKWLRVRLTGPSGQAGAFGAKVATYEAGQAGNPNAMISFREARSQEGYLGQNDPVLHFGLGSRSTVDVRVTFLNGQAVTQQNVAANQILSIDAFQAPPVIDKVVPDPDTATPGVLYQRQLSLQQGSWPVTWQIMAAPPGGQVSSSGLVTGWTPGPPDLAALRTFTIQASNAYGSDTASWQVVTFSRADLDRDGDVDQVDFGILQECFSGDALPYRPGCQVADIDGDGDVDQADFTFFFECAGGPNRTPAC